jgi:hypothetical protein
MHLQDRVHRLMDSDYGVDGARSRAQIAADTGGFVNQGNPRHTGAPERVVQRNDVAPE